MQTMNSSSVKLRKQRSDLKFEAELTVRALVRDLCVCVCVCVFLVSFFMVLLGFC